MVPEEENDNISVADNYTANTAADTIADIRYSAFINMTTLFHVAIALHQALTLAATTLSVYVVTPALNMFCSATICCQTTQNLSVAAAMYLVV